jgi:hypothetical protein
MLAHGQIDREAICAKLEEVRRYFDRFMFHLQASFIVFSVEPRRLKSAAPTLQLRRNPPKHIRLR